MRCCVNSVLAVLAFLAVPSAAHAGLEAGPIEFGMYGRVGAAWNPQNGRFVHGTYLNLLGGPIGGRLEEGDYLEPTIKLNIVKPTAEDNTKPYFHFVITPSMFSNNGSFIGAFANNFSAQLRIELFQAYLEAGNVLLPDLKIWAGQRFYRGSDVHIADYYFFNQLNSQGFGAKYKGLDVAVLLQTGGSSQYASVYDDQNPTTQNPTIQRQRTVFVGQYVMPVMEKHSVHLLGEFHYLPATRAQIGSDPLAERDNGWVLGAKGRLDLGGGSFNELSVRYGRRIANGAFSGSPTWGTVGRAAENGKFGGAFGFEAVDHFMYNVGNIFTVNAYGILQFSKGADEEARLSAAAPINKGMNFALGARTFVYLHDQFHLINELTLQGFDVELPETVEEDPGMPMATKFTIMPTLVPSGERSPWARPHFRFIYTLAVYNQAARDAHNAGIGANVSSYMNLFGPRQFAHYVGTRAEWWF
jgi:maltoporin